MISVLRLGHRVARDKRISTHCGLVARAFGADEIIFSGDSELAAISSVEGVTRKWGGNFSARYEKNWRKFLREFRGIVAHLTMYGEPFEKKISLLKAARKRGKDLLVVIGAEKVPREVYERADYNLSVTLQPHSEVAALAVFLYELNAGGRAEFAGAKLKIIPAKRGKKVWA